MLLSDRNNLEKSLLREVEEALVRVRKALTASARNATSRFPPSASRRLLGQFCVRCQEILGAMSSES